MEIKKLSKKELEERLKEYRKYYPKQKLFYTEDGNFFLEKSPAVDHATKTKQKWFEDGKTEGDETESNDQPELTKEVAIQKLKELELSDKTEYAAMKELLLPLGITPKSNKKAEVLTALQEYKLTLNE
jgi:hypothetical protein